MLASISPLVERVPGTRWWRLAGSYLVGAIVGGAAVGAVLGAVGEALRLRHSWVALAAATAVLAVLAALTDLVGRVPSRRRQVDETWLSTYRDWVIGSGFGVQLGVGAVTIVTSASTYLTWWFEAASGSPAVGAVIGGCFGLARGLPLLSMTGVRDATELRRRNAAIVTALPIARRLAIGAQLSIAGLVGVAAVVAAR